ncbi:MAG: hypothetical protein WEA24_02580 [Gemmatimonadota bacterium]
MFTGMLGVVALQGLTVGYMLRNIPHDPAAFVVYALLAVFVGFIWHGSRNKPTA